MTGEKPAWLTAALDQRVAELSEAMSVAKIEQLIREATVMVLLSEPPEDPTPVQLEIWERSCDNCKVFCGPMDQFFTGHQHVQWNGLDVVVTFGACQRCAMAD